MVALRVKTGIAGEAQHLRALDLGVPVGALDQPHHDPAVQPRRPARRASRDGARALAVGLHDDAEPVPAGEASDRPARARYVERQVEPVGFLGVDVEADVGCARSRRELAARAAPARQHRARAGRPRSADAAPTA